MENKDSRYSPAPLPLTQRQLPLPFILPEKLGPLPVPAPPTRPSIPAVRSENPVQDLCPGPISPYTAPGSGRFRDTSHGSTFSGFIFRPEQRARSLELSPLPLLPPPLPSPFTPNTSPGGPPSTNQVGSSNNQREILATPLWQSPDADDQSQGKLYSGYALPETPSQNLNHGPMAVRYRCDKCPETFISNGALKRHRRVHLERSYQCVCGVAYTEMSALRVSTYPSIASHLTQIPDIS